MFVGKEFIDTIRNWKNKILLEINDINQQHLLSSNCINYDLRWKQSYGWENLNSNLQGKWEINLGVNKSLEIAK